MTIAVDYNIVQVWRITIYLLCVRTRSTTAYTSMSQFNKIADNTVQIVSGLKMETTKFANAVP